MTTTTTNGIIIINNNNKNTTKQLSLSLSSSSLTTTITSASSVATTTRTIIFVIIYHNSSDKLYLFIGLFIYLVNSVYFLKGMALTAMNKTVNQYLFSITQRVADVRLYVVEKMWLPSCSVMLIIARHCSVSSLLCFIHMPYFYQTVYRAGVKITGIK